MKTQPEMTLDYIREFGSITDLEAMRDLGIMRLGSVVHILRTRGYNVVTNSRTSKNRYGRKTNYAVYTLKETEND